MKKLLVFEHSHCLEYPCKRDFIVDDLNVIVGKDVTVNNISLEANIIKTVTDKAVMMIDNKYKKVFERPFTFSMSSQGELIIHKFNHNIIIDGMSLILEDDIENIYINGELSDNREFENGDIVQIGFLRFIIHKHSISLFLDEEAYETTLLEIFDENRMFEGFPFYRRSPRIIKREVEDSIQVLDPPQVNKLKVKGIVATFFPTVVMSGITVGIGMIMGRGLMLISSVAGSVMTLITGVTKFVNDNKENKFLNKRRMDIYEKYMLEIRKRVYIDYETSKEAMEYNYPTLHEISDLILNHSSRLYERSRTDDDFLEICIGTVSGKSSFDIEVNFDEMSLDQDELKLEAKSLADDYSHMDNVPVKIDLKQAHLGLVGEKKDIHKHIKDYIFQLTFFQSYRDVEIIHIYDESYIDDFSYLKWYPHFKIHAINALGTVHNERIRDQVLSSVYQILKDRKVKSEGDEKDKDYIYSPYYLFIIDEPQMILNHSIMEFLQLQINDLDYSIIYTTNKVSKLPENIKSVIFLNDDEIITLLIENGDYQNKKMNVRDSKNIPFERHARMLSTIVHEEKMSSQIPDSIGFLEMYNVEEVEELPIIHNWKQNLPFKSLSVPLGVRAKDDIVNLDLHEKAHGPHGLVAGTTGSGKSEIVQSYILSLAINFHPHDVGFLLIDYKGGGMANLFRHLPHLLGTITNLDGSESMRALVSINSELKRRQRIFDQAGVNNINAYHKKLKSEGGLEPLPHLFLISDEFAELKREQPEFMQELVSTARIGRSLGIHLILATQKPSGVVDDQIWSNSKFKLCLKVQDVADSKEMLKTPDAAMITEPGRAYLQVGNNEIYELFQSAYSGSTYKTFNEEKTIDNRVYLINDLGQGQVINQDLSMDDEKDVLKDSELDAVINHIDQLFDTLDSKAVRKPWLPSLPTSIANHRTLKSVEMENEEDLNLNVVLGSVDIPEEQVQAEYAIDLQREGNVLSVSSSSYGKTMFLGNSILNLASKNSVDLLNMYLLDFGTGGLNLYRELPHVADYITIDDDEKVKKFMTLIQDEIQERKKIITNAMTQNFSIHNRSHQNKLNAIVVMIDQFDMIRELGLDVENLFTKFLRDGASLGIYFMITASRSGDIRFASLNQIKHKIAGFTFDQSEAIQLVGRSQWKLPDIKGRALVKMETVNIAQLYLPVDFKDDLEYTQKVISVIKTIQMKNVGSKAESIAVLPDELHYADLSNFKKLFKADFYVGLDRETVKLVGTSIKDEPLLIIGQQKSGKTTVINNILKQLDSRIIIFDSSQRLLNSHSTRDNVEYYWTNEDYVNGLDSLKLEIEKRSIEYQKAIELDRNLLPMEFYKKLESVYLVVDDVDYLNDIAKANLEGPNLFYTASEIGLNVIVAVDSNKVSSMNKYLTAVKNTSQAVIVGEPGLLNLLNLRSNQFPKLGEARLGVNEGMWNIMTIKEDE